MITYTKHEAASYWLLLLLLVAVAFLIPFHENVPELSAAIFFLSFIHFFKFKDVKFEKFGLYKPVFCTAAIFIIWVVLRSLSFFSIAEFKNIFRYSGILYLPILIFMPSKLLSVPKRFFLIVGSFLAANFIIAAYSIVLAIISGNYYDLSFMGLFPHHWFPGVMAFAIPISACLLISNGYGKRSKIFNLLLISLLSVCVYMASRRGIILSVICSLTVISLYLMVAMKKKKSIVIVLVVLTAMSLVMISNPRFKDISKEYDGYRYDIRLTMWNTAYEMAVEKPIAFLIGHGLDGGFREYNARLRNIEHFPAFMKDKFNSSHNDFIDIFIVFGAIGLAAFIAFLMACLRQSIRDKNVFLLSFIVMGISQFAFGSHFFWFRSGKFAFFFLLSLFLSLNPQKDEVACLDSKAPKT